MAVLGNPPVFPRSAGPSSAATTSATPPVPSTAAVSASIPSLFRRFASAMARRRVSLLLAVCAAAAAASAASPGIPQHILDASNDSFDWQRYVRSPPTAFVSPVRIVAARTAGNVTNAEALVGGGVPGPALLTRRTVDETAPTIVLDFGQVVAGLLTVDFAEGSTAGTNGTGLPGIRLAFSETLQHLTDRSDFTRSDNAGGRERLTAGTDQIAVQPRPYRWLDQLGCAHGQQQQQQVCADGLHGFRYVQIRLDAVAGDAPFTAAHGTVAVAAVGLRFVGLLGTADTFTGHFACSDANLTQWWYDAVYTNDLCTAVFRANDTEPRGAASPSLLGKRVLHDGPKRDRDPYVGDLAVAALTTYLSHDAADAPRNVLEDVAQHQRADGWLPPASINNYTLPLFDYPLWWVVSSADLVQYTGNLTYARAYYSVLERVLDDYYPAHTDSATGLVVRPPGTGDYAFVPRHGILTYDNALYAHALVHAATLADALANAADAARWRARAAAIGPALVRRNFDAAAGAFFDGASCANDDDDDDDDDDDSLCDTHPQDGNSLAILAGLVPLADDAAASPGPSAASILAYVDRAMARPYGNAFFDNSLLAPGSDYGNRVYAFISYFELAARFEAAAAPLAALRRLYGWMASHDPGITVWEGIGAHGVPYEGGFTSMAHGWSTGIVPLAMRYVLGVAPAAPGFREWSVRPRVLLPEQGHGVDDDDGDDLTWARGLVPTPYGGITVQWQKTLTTAATNTDGSASTPRFALTLLVDAPPATTGTATLPFAALDARSVAVDGRVVYGRAGRLNTLGATLTVDGAITLPLPGGKHMVVVS